MKMISKGRDIKGRFIKNGFRTKRQIKIICLVCKKQFEIRHCRKNTAKYCSRKCLGESKIGHIAWNKGKKTGIHHSKQFKKGMIPWNKGKKFPQYSGKNNHWWKGGMTKHKAGYIYIYQPQHPFAKNNHNYVFEHRLVIEKYLGRYLKPQEVVHHINGVRDDNRFCNLKLFKNNSEHSRFHKINAD